MDAVTDGRYRIIGFGGGIRGTKTWGVLAVLITLSRIFPGSRWCVVRKDLQRLKDTVFPSFEKLRFLTGGFIGPICDSLDLAMAARCTNGSAILFRGENIDKDPELLRFHGYEVNGFANEEADELSERTLTKEKERAGTWIIPGDKPQPSAFIFNTFNPCGSWPRRVFYQAWKTETIQPPYIFIPSTAADNPYISDAQREAWEEMPEAEYKRFVMGDWESLTGAYYDTLTPACLIARTDLPARLPDDWRFWASYDWGYSHWAVMGAWATDPQGVDYLLDSVWLRKAQDDAQAVAFREELDPRCLGLIFAGHDCWAKPTAHGASGVSTADVFAEAKLLCRRADIDRVNGGRAVIRQLKQGKVKIVKTPNNLKGYDQLSTILPDENDVRKPAKIDADDQGNGGDDFADMFRYGLATVIATRKPKESPDTKLPDKAQRLVVEDGRLVKPPRPPRTVEELAEWAAGRAHKGQLPARERERLPRRTYR